MLTRRLGETEENSILLHFGCSAAGMRCFYCGEMLQDPAVMWHGETGQSIYVHAPCVVQWMPVLLRDALALLYAGHPCQRVDQESLDSAKR